MPTLTWVEDNSSRSARIVRLGRKAQSTYVKSWKIFGSSDDLVVHTDVNNELYANYLFWQYPGQPANQLHADHYTLEYLGDDAWQLQVTYTKEGAEEPQEEGGDGGGGGGGQPLKRTRSFDTSGGTQHITQADGGKVTQVGSIIVRSGTERRYPPTAPSMDSAIGVDGDSVAGVDIIVPALTWTETYDVPARYVTNQYVKTVSALTGTTNDNTFRGFAAGEVLFMGCSGSQEWDSQKGDGPWSLSYKFSASANVTGQTIGGITGIAKNGHEYLWVRYEDALDGAATTSYKKPKYVYVNTVYKEGNFSGLGIGTS